MSNKHSQPFRPRSYQKRSIKFLLEHACAGLLLAPGLGKTASSLAAIAFLLKRGIARKWLVIAPVRPCYSVWPKEIQKWADFNHLRIEILHGPGKEAALLREADLYVINPEGMDWLLDVKYEKVSEFGKKKKAIVDAKRFAKFGFDGLIIDELSRYKAHDTNRIKAIKPVLHTFGRRWGLTAAPAANGLMGLFGQAFVLDLGNALGPYITRYQSSYFIPDKYGHTWKLMPGAEERIYEQLAPLMLRIDDSVLDMPELVENDILVELDPATMLMYKTLHDDLITAVDEGVITAATAASASMKCRQLANGGLYLDREMSENGLFKPKGERKWTNIHTKKVEALRDLVDELQGSPLLVAYDFEHDLDRLRKEFPNATYACDFSARHFDRVESDWNAGKIELLFGHPASIGHGLNLQGCAQHVAWHSLTWDYDLYDQFIRRVHRQGNIHKRVYVHRIIAARTIDEVIIQALATKQAGQEAFFEGIMRLGRKLRRKK